MAVKDTISKIAKGIGDSNIGQNAKKAGKFINKHVLEDIPENRKYWNIHTIFFCEIFVKFFDKLQFCWLLDNHKFRLLS